MELQLDIICENTVGRPVSAYGEHGFSCLINHSSGKWLFDTGSGETLLGNLSVLGHDVHDIDGVFLSHGHYDHSGGLMPLLKETGRQKVYAHSGIFKERFWQGQHEQRDISLPYQRDELEKNGADFVFLDHLKEIAPGFYFSGVIPQLSADETGDPHLVQHVNSEGEITADRFEDDAALAFDTTKGLVVVLGCSHAGVINTVEYFRKELAVQKVYAVIGGMHLGPASDEQFAATLDYLVTLNPARLGLSHCTGQIRSAQLHARFPRKVFFANVGTSVKI